MKRGALLEIEVGKKSFSCWKIAIERGNTRVLTTFIPYFSQIQNGI
jgi:hypothetical protein